MPLPSSLTGLSVADYIVFTVMLVGSLGIGVYHAIRGNKTTEDFLMASHSMTPIPVALSLTATFISSISILGYVGEVYGHGIQLIWSLVGIILGITIATNVFIPIIYPLQLNSINEYLELRFRSRLLKLCVLVQTMVSWILYLGLCLYAPTLALEAVTPISSGTYILILGVVVTLYSSFGGMKAVVWTDAFQTIVIIAGIVTATVAALVKVGGPGEVWRTATQHGRTDALDTSFGLYKRHTIFNTILMSLVNFTSFYSFSQTTIQRISTMPSLNKVKLVLYLNLLGLVSLILILFVTGLGIFAIYADCDPISLGHINSKDQIFPYFVLDHLGFLKGVPGLFVACLFSGTMSSISSMLNSLPTMLWVDFLSKLPYFMKASERVKTITNKLITFAMGLTMIGLAFMSSKLGGLIQATATLMSVSSGSTFGVFLMGFCIPICGKRGAMAGLFSSIIFMSWLAIGAQYHGLKTTMLPFSTSSCGNNTGPDLPDLLQLDTLSSSTTEALLEMVPEESSSHVLAGLYGISYTFTSALGTLVCLLVGVVVSLMADRESLEEIDPAYVLPCLRQFVGKQLRTGTAEVKPFLEPNFNNSDKRTPILTIPVPHHQQQVGSCEGLTSGSKPAAVKVSPAAASQQL